MTNIDKYIDKQITIRKLQKNDLDNGFLKLLNSSQNNNIDKLTLEQNFEMINSNSLYTILIAILNNEIIATITLILEPKFIHDGKFVGHIEDVMVIKKYRNKKIGTLIINKILDHAKSHNCYKTILNCNDNTKIFYEKLGFKKSYNCMRYDY